jgi:hypothetical protein
VYLREASFPFLCRQFASKYGGKPGTGISDTIVQMLLNGFTLTDFGGLGSRSWIRVLAIIRNARKALDHSRSRKGYSSISTKTPRSTSSSILQSLHGIERAESAKKEECCFLLERLLERPGGGGMATGADVREKLNEQHYIASVRKAKCLGHKNSQSLRATNTSERCCMAFA